MGLARCCERARRTLQELSLRRWSSPRVGSSPWAAGRRLFSSWHGGAGCGAVVQESCYCDALEAALMGAWRWNKGTYISYADSGLCEGLGKHLSGSSLSEQQVHGSAGLTLDVAVRSGLRKRDSVVSARKCPSRGQCIICHYLSSSGLCTCSVCSFYTPVWL